MNSDKRSRAFEIAALVCGILAATTCCCLYTSYIAGGLAILFAVLSKGGELTMSAMARIAFWLGIIAILFSTAFYVSALVMTLQEYGSIEGILRAYCEMTNLDFNEVYGELFPAN